MRLPVIKKINEFIQANDEDFVAETIQVLEFLSEEPSLKENEVEVIGELLSNFFGALEVAKEVKNGVDSKTALNNFMKRVMGSIDK